MRVFNRLPGLSKGAAALIIGVSVAAATALPRQACAESAFKNLAQLNAVYVADPAAAWFERWAEANLKTHDWLNRPDIKIKAGGDLVAAVAADPSGIGLLTRGELSRLQAAGAPQIVAVSTGVSICAALSVNTARTEENFGDFALSSDTIEAFATADTLAIAEALVDAHRFKDRITLKEVKAASAFAELASGKSALAILPVLPEARLDVPDNAVSLRSIGMSEAATEALRMRGLNPRDYRTSFFQQLPLINGVRTACDEIVMIKSADTTLDPDVFAAPAPLWTNPFTGSDLEKRVRQALDALKSLWGKSAEHRG